jgi:hypothetical protein
VLSENEYERLMRNARSSAPTFVEHLLAMPRDEDVFGREVLVLRDVDSQ